MVIVGGGYAGLRVALWLDRHARGDADQVTLVDQNDVHLNPGVLYEVATALNPRERESVGRVLHETASVPFAKILEGTRVRFLRARVEQITPASRTLRLEGGENVETDILVVAVGSELSTFGVPGVAAHAFSIKSLPEAVELRHHLVRQFLTHRSASRPRQLQAFRVAVVGGGSAGVELAAELALFLRKLSRLHRVDPRVSSVVLYESSDTVLREYPAPLRDRGVRRLRSLGVTLVYRQAVCGVGSGYLACPGEVFVLTDTVVWLAGIRAHGLLLRSGFPTHPRGGLYVEPTLEVRGCRNVFAAGDCVCAEDLQTGLVVPDVAYAALQQGNVVARNIRRRLRGQALTSYLDRPRPTLATVGGKFALVHYPPFQFAGTLAWYLKQLVDLCYLCGILPNDVALRTWLKSVRVRMANDG